MHIRILISDPWDLGEALSWRPLEGELVRTEDDDHGGRGLIYLNDPIEHEGSRYKHVVASPRHEGDTLAGLLAGRSVFCGLIGVSDEDARVDTALDTSGWRGGLAFIGTVEPSPGGTPA
jgi:hypothetical protein